jgi:hypothetical protein
MRTILAVAASFLLLACSRGERELSPITTTADGSKYVNELFGLEITKPEGWYAQDQEAAMKMSQKGAQLIAGDDKSMNALVSEALKTTIPLFGFFQHPPGAAVDMNPNIVSVAENVGGFPGVKTGCDYLFHVRKMFEEAAVEVSVSEGCERAEINGTSFGYIETIMTLGARRVRQRYYACVQGEHALSVVQTYRDDETKQLVDEPLNTLSVSCN